MGIFDKFDKTVDTEGLQNDLKNAEEGKSEYRDVPHGKYEVEVAKIEPTISKKGSPMLTIWFRILKGNYAKSILFYNQTFDKGFGLHKANEMLRDLVFGEIDITFESFSQYEDLIYEVAEFIDAEQTEYALNYSESKTAGFHEFIIEEVF